MKAEKFLTADQQKRIVEAVKAAELNTSGEIRVHIENRCSCDPMERAAFVLKYLGMDRTKDRNGVVIYLACQSKVFSIVGDEGIDKVVPENFWNDICAAMSGHFRAGRFAEGLEEAVMMVGEKLKAFFPYREDDVNEQPDHISFGTENHEADA